MKIKAIVKLFVITTLIVQTTEHISNKINTQMTFWTFETNETSLSPVEIQNNVFSRNLLSFVFLLFFILVFDGWDHKTPNLFIGESSESSKSSKS